MAIENSKYHAIEHRRSMVAELRLKGLTLEEVSIALYEQANIFNTRTRKPYSIETIRKDLTILKGRWQEQAFVHTDEHMSRQLQELAQIKRSAWANGNPDLALRALNTEMKLLGTLAPTKIELSGSLTIEYVQRLVVEMEKAGLNPESVFERIMQRVKYVNRAELS